MLDQARRVRMLEYFDRFGDSTVVTHVVLKVEHCCQDWKGGRKQCQESCGHEPLWTESCGQCFERRSLTRLVF